MRRRFAVAPVILIALVLVQGITVAQVRPAIDNYIAPGYPYELVAARKADRRRRTRRHA
jgi:hypothetical protein